MPAVKTIKNLFGKCARNLFKYKLLVHMRKQIMMKRKKEKKMA